jgi:hypothetical protein
VFRLARNRNASTKIETMDKGATFIFLSAGGKGIAAGQLLDFADYKIGCFHGLRI